MLLTWEDVRFGQFLPKIIDHTVYFTSMTYWLCLSLSIMIYRSQTVAMLK
jgi:hypothetical protein